MTAILAAAVTMARARSAERPCQFCKNGRHEKCVLAYVTPSGEHACICAYSWQHAELWAKTRGGI